MAPKLIWKYKEEEFKGLLKPCQGIWGSQGRINPAD